MTHKILLCIMLAVFFSACIPSEYNKNEIVLIFKANGRDTLYYVVNDEAPRLNDSIKIIKKIYLVSGSEKSITAGLNYFFYKNDSLARKTDVSCELNEGKTLEEQCNINELFFRLFFQLPKSKIKAGTRWEFTSPYKYDNLTKTDYSSKAIGIVKNIPYDIKDSTCIEIEYEITSKRDFNSGKYTGGENIHVKDEILIIAKGSFLIEQGAWKQFNITESYKSFSPKPTEFTKKMQLSLDKKS